MVLNHFKEIDITKKETIKHELLKFVYYAMTSMVTLMNQAKMKSVQKTKIQWC